MFILRSPAELEALLRSSTRVSDGPESFWGAMNERLRFFKTLPQLRYRIAPADESYRPEIDHPWWVVVRWEGQQYDLFIDAALYSPHPDTEYVLDRAFLVTIALSFARVFLDSEHGETIICLHDWGEPSAMSFTGIASDASLIPDTSYIRSYAHEWFRIGVAQSWLPWKARHPVAVWRGGLHGVLSHAPTDDWSWLPRAHLCSVAEAISHRKAVDARLTAMSQWVLEHYPEEAERVRRFFGEPIKPLAHMAYRYQIDIDGTANAWSGLFRKLLTGSTVLKVASAHGFRQWYYDLLEPWIHFVPVRSDLSDLDAALEFVLANETEAEEIGAAGRRLALSLGFEAEIFAMARTLARHGSTPALGK